MKKMIAAFVGISLMSSFAAAAAEPSIEAQLLTQAEANLQGYQALRAQCTALNEGVFALLNRSGDDLEYSAILQEETFRHGFLNAAECVVTLSRSGDVREIYNFNASTQNTLGADSINRTIVTKLLDAMTISEQESLIDTLKLQNF